MYKNKGKLMTNDTISDDIVLYTEGMSIQELANRLQVQPAEIIKKLFTLGIMAKHSRVRQFDWQQRKTALITGM